MSHLKTTIILILFYVLMQIVACRGNPEKAHPVPEGYVSLFNGSDFTGWNIQPDLGAWIVQDSVIFCKGKPGSPYAILTKKKYENFELFVDFKMSKNCNSGIFIHTPEYGRESRVGFELQILDSYGKKVDKQACGAIYNVETPEVNAVKPAGEWNTFHVKFDWPRCQIWLNDKKIQDVDFWRNPALRYRLRSGYIGLQNHAHKVWFRNIYVKELASKEKWTDLFNGKNLSGWHSVGNANWRVANGKIIADGREGYLVSDDEYKHFEFQAYVERGRQKDGGGFYYRWKNESDPGYKTEFYNFKLAKQLLQQYSLNPEEKPGGYTLPAFTQKYLLTQIISYDRESIVRLNGLDVQRNLNLVNVRSGHIVLYHKPGDGKFRVFGLRIKELNEFAF